MGRGNLLLISFLAVAVVTVIVIAGHRSSQITETEVASQDPNPAASGNGTSEPDQSATDLNASNGLSPSSTALSSAIDSDAGPNTASSDDNSSSNSDPAAQAQSDVTAQESRENEYTEDDRQVLSQEVFEIIDEVQKRFLEEQWMEGANELNALYEEYDSLNDFEKATILNFYTNLLLANNMFPEAMDAFETMLEIETLRPDIRLRAIRAMGQLNQAEGQLENAVAYFDQYLAESDDRNEAVLLDLANSHYQLGQHSEAIAPLTEHIERLIETGQEVDRNKLGLLNILALESGDWDSAALVNEMMIEAYNDPRDWRNLADIYQRLGDDARHQQLLSDALSADYIDQSGNWVELIPQ